MSACLLIDVSVPVTSLPVLIRHQNKWSWSFYQETHAHELDIEFALLFQYNIGKHIFSQQGYETNGFSTLFP